MKRMLLTSASLVLILASVAAAADESGFVPLFDGRTLDGWVQRNGLATYRVENECIVGRTAPNSPNSFLCTTKAYCDFELVVEVQVDEGLNSGVQIRSRSSQDYNSERVHGPQVEIETAPGASGYIYSEATGRGWLSPNRDVKDAYRNGQWNEYRVRAVGPRIQVSINGRPVADVTDEASSRCGFIGLQVHGVGDRGPFQVRWRNIRIKDLNPDATAASQTVQFQPAPDIKQKPASPKKKKNRTKKQ